MSNDEHLADKLTSLLQTALRAHQSNPDIANATSFKRLAGTYELRDHSHPISIGSVMYIDGGLAQLVATLVGSTKLLYAGPG